MKESFKSQYQGQLQRREVHCERRSKEESSQGQIPGRVEQVKRLMLSDILNWKSTKNTDGSEQEREELIERNLPIASRQLKANITQIFKGPRGTDGNRIKKLDFKIGKSLEGNTKKNSVIIEKSMRGSSRDFIKVKRETSVHHDRLKRSSENSKEKEEDKRTNKPPLPKPTKNNEKFNEIYYSKKDMNGQSINVKVNVQIMASHNNAKKIKGQVPHPPKPPQQRLANIKAKQGEGTETKLICQKTKSQNSLILPDIITKSSFMSNNSNMEASAFFDGSRNSLHNMGLNKELTKSKKTQTGRSLNNESGQLAESKVYGKNSHCMGENKVNQRLSNRYSGGILIQHQNFISSTRDQLLVQIPSLPVQVEECREEASNSQTTTPNLLLKEQEDEIFGRNEICMFKRRNSEICLSSNTKNKIKFFLKDKVTRDLFEKIYKERASFNLNSSVFN